MEKLLSVEVFKKKKDGLHTHWGDFLQRRRVSVGKDMEL